MMPQYDRQEILSRTNGFCGYCGKSISNEDWHIDHIKPKLRGGRNNKKNLVASCQRCNLSKNCQSVDEYRDRAKTKALGSIDEMLQCLEWRFLHSVKEPQAQLIRKYISALYHVIEHTDVVFLLDMLE